MWAVLIAAGFFSAMGLVALAAPERILALFDIRTVPMAARNEVRAVYGGFGLAVGALLFASLARPDVGHGVRLTVATALIGMAAGRVYSWIVDRRFAAWPALFWALELLLAALLLRVSAA